MKSFLSLVLLVCIALYAWVTFKPEAAEAQLELEGRVVAIIDGDSIKFSTGDDILRVELAGIDAPEIGQSFSDTSIFYLKDLIDGRHVRIEVLGTNDYGDIIGEVFLNQLPINRLMLTEGYAWATRGKFRNRSWDSLESLARNKRMGLWRMDNPVPPWSYREELKNS